MSTENVSDQNRLPLRHERSIDGTWRIPASKLIWAAALKSKWSEDFERMEGMLFGYEEWQNDWRIDNLRKRGRKFGIAAHRAPEDA